ncbi:MAG: response regulator [Cyanobacteriota bacterium]
MKLLLVEDEASLATAIVEALSADYYIVDTACDAQEAQDYLEVYPYDLLLLDVGLPDQNGIDLCRDLRTQGYTQPILLLTAHNQSQTKVEGLDAGADDYLVKPFEMAELAARIRALLRRGQVAQQPILSWGELRLDPASCEVSFADTALHLTPKEYALLELFLRNPQRVFSQSAILDHLWTYENLPGTDTVRAHIKGLRHKLKSVAAPDVIETVYGLGYRLKAPPEDLTTPSEPNLADPELQEQPNRSSKLQRTQQALAKTWQRYRTQYWQQIDTLEDFVSQLSAEISQNPELEITPHEAEREAHKLAGSLGTFGFSQGLDLARQIQLHNKHNKQLSGSQLKHLRKTIAALRQAFESFDTTHANLPVIVAYWSAATSPLFKKLAIQHGFRIKAISNLDALSHPQNFTPSPSAWLIDLDEIQDTDPITTLIKSKRNKPQVSRPFTSLFLLTERTDLLTRVETSRLGKHILLQKSLSFNEICINFKTQLDLQTSTSSKNSTLKRVKILVIEDDESILSALDELLNSWGLEIHILSEPKDFWKQLNHLKPELLILDVEMPRFSGIELCQVVRNDPDWSWIPVLFLSAHTDPQIIEQVFSAGRDDFVSKPIVGPELISRIFNRLERTEFLRRAHQGGDCG